MKYYSVEDTPLKFHTFYRFISMPLGAITALLAVFSTVTVMNNIFYLLDIFFYVVQMVACAAAFIGFFKWKPYAWYAVMINLLNNIVYYVLILIVHVAFSTGDFAYDIGAIMGSGIVSALIFVYYNKRKPLFFNTPNPAEQANAHSLANRFCPRCGARVTTSGNFCTYCGSSLF